MVTRNSVSVYRFAILIAETVGYASDLRRNLSLWILPSSTGSTVGPKSELFSTGTGWRRYTSYCNVRPNIVCCRLPLGNQVHSYDFPSKITLMIRRDAKYHVTSNVVSSPSRANHPMLRINLCANTSFKWANYTFLV